MPRFLVDIAAISCRRKSGAILIEPYGKLMCCSDGWLQAAAFDAVFEGNLELVRD